MLPWQAVLPLESARQQSPEVEAGLSLPLQQIPSVRHSDHSVSLKRPRQMTGPLPSERPATSSMQTVAQQQGSSKLRSGHSSSPRLSQPTEKVLSLLLPFKRPILSQLPSAQPSLSKNLELAPFKFENIHGDVVFAEDITDYVGNAGNSKNVNYQRHSFAIGTKKTKAFGNTVADERQRRMNSSKKSLD